MKRCPVCSTEYLDHVRFCANDGQTLRASSPGIDLVGQVVADRYHVVKKLGEGGMGQVYLAEHVKMGRKSAIKVMNPAMVHDADAVARFNREAANASRITHPNVCAIYDFGETPEGLIYLAMEFVEGEPLTDLVAREGALPLRRAVAIFVQAAEALQAAHDLGIVHRDLKPDNIMLTRGRDGADVVKVVDFGIAKAVSGDDGQKVTKSGLIVGTPEYMSPEQLAGDRLDGRSDIYALALVLFKMLTGKLPFEASTVQEAMIKRLTDDPALLATVRPDLSFPAGLQETLSAALNRTPVGRYQVATKFADDVAGVVGLTRGTGRTALLPLTRGDPRQRTELLDSPSRARPRALVLIALGALLALGGGVAVAVLARGGRPEPAAASPDTAPGVTAGAPSRPARGGRASGPIVPPLRSRAGQQITPRGAAAPRITAANAGAVLDALIDRPTAVILDSALVVYNAPAVSGKERAFAACLLAQAYSHQQDDTTALQWARRGLALDPALLSCQQIVRHAGGP